MSSVFQTISNLAFSSRNFIHIELKIESEDLTQECPVESERFHAIGNDSWYLKLKLTEKDQVCLFLWNEKAQLFGKLFIDVDVTVYNGDEEVLEHGTYSTLTHDLPYDLLRMFVKTFSSLKKPLRITSYLEVRNSNLSTLPKAPVCNVIQLECLKELAENLKKSLDQSINSDITLRADGVDLKAHKMILCSRSRVFDKMFDHDTSETSQNVIEIKDVRAPVMAELLTFLYTGQKNVLNLEDESDLYYAADKYELLTLREVCKKNLLSKLRADTAGQLWKLADRHCEQSFKKGIIRFLNAHFKDVVDTEVFEELTKIDPTAAVSMMRNYVRATTMK